MTLTVRHAPAMRVSALEYVETLNAGSLIDQLTARRASRDAAFMSIPEVSDPPVDQYSNRRS